MLALQNTSHVNKALIRDFLKTNLIKPKENKQEQSVLVSFNDDLIREVVRIGDISNKSICDLSQTCTAMKVLFSPLVRENRLKHYLNVWRARDESRMWNAFIEDSKGVS